MANPSLSRISFMLYHSRPETSNQLPGAARGLGKRWSSFQALGRDKKSVEILIDLLRSRVGSPTSMNSLAEDLQMFPYTVRHWIQILEQLCVVFPVLTWLFTLKPACRRDRSLRTSYSSN